MAIAQDHTTPVQNIVSGTPFSVPSSTGNLSVVAFIGGATATITSVTDNQSNAYYPAITFNESAGAFINMAIWYAPGAATGITSITINYINGGGGNYEDAVIYDFSGAHPTNPLVNGDYTDDIGTGSTATTNPVGPALSYPYGGGAALSILHGGNVSSVASPYTLDFKGSSGSEAEVGFASMVFGSPGTFAPSWTTTSGAWFSVVVLFASNTGPNNLRFAKGKTAIFGNSVTTANSLTVTNGDLVVIVASADPGKSSIPPAFTDNVSNSYTTISAINPYVGETNDGILFAGYGIIGSSAGACFWNFNHDANEGNVIYVIVITPSVTPTFNAIGTGFEASSVTHFTAASCSPTAGDYLFAALASYGAVAPQSFSANGSWILGPNEGDGTYYIDVAVEFQLSAVGGSTTDDFTALSGTGNEVIFSFSLPAGSISLYPNDMTPGTLVTWR